MVAASTEIQRTVLGPIGGLFGPWEKSLAGRYDEILVEGAAGSAKSHNVYLWAHTIGTTAPRGTRGLIVRNTFTSLADSSKASIEDDILANDTAWSSILRRGGTRENRRSYEYPNCYIALRGLDKPGKLYSTRWDFVIVEEAWECSMDAIARFVRGLRFSVFGHPVLILITNPSHRYHWINRLFPPGHRTAPATGKGARIRLLSRHEDNPALATRDPGLLERLDRLPEPLRSQLRYGLWVSKSGLMWPQYDEASHLVDRWVEARGSKHYLCGEGIEPIELEWFGASMDFGYTHAGCFGVWGVAKDGRSWLVGEVYRTGWQQAQWAEAIEDLHAEFPLRCIVADCEDPRFIDYLNHELSFAKGGKTGRKVFGCDKSKGKLFGQNAVRRALDQHLIHFLRPERRMRHWPDDGLKEGAPTCSTEEIPAYARRDPDSAPSPEQAAIREREEIPAKGIADDGCDMIRYWCTYKYADWDPRFTQKEPAKQPLFGTVEFFDTTFPGEKKLRSVMPRR